MFKSMGIIGVDVEEVLDESHVPIDSDQEHIILDQFIH
jgi:hypothetical protein